MKDSTHLPSPPFSTPLLKVKELQFGPSSINSRSFPFPSSKLSYSSLNNTSLEKLTPRSLPNSSSSPSPPSSTSSTNNSKPRDLKITTTTNFNQSLISTLPHHKTLFNPKPIPIERTRQFNLITPSSSANSSLTPCKRKKRGVEFCSTPLGSLNANPKHKFHLYPKKKKGTASGTGVNFIYSNRSDLEDEDMKGLSEEEAEESEEIIEEGGIVSSPAARGHNTSEVGAFNFQNSSRLERLGEAMVLEGEDCITDDEEEEIIVEALLLSQEQLSSPLRLTPFSLSLPDLSKYCLPKSILKKSAHKIEVVGNAMEGAKRNGGRVKHMVGFGEVELTASGRKILVPLTSNSSQPSFTNAAGGAGGGNGKNSKVPSSSVGGDPFGNGGNIGASEGGKNKENGKGKSREDGSGRDGNNGGGRDGEDGSRTHHHLRDDDPISLRTPLLILKASLQPVPANYIRQQDASEENSPGAVPRPQSNSSTLSSPLGSYMQASGINSPPKASTSEISAPSAMPILLSEVEAAYMSLVRTLVRLPKPLVSPTKTLEPLVLHRSSLIKCLERDITNVLTLPSSTSARPINLSSRTTNNNAINNLLNGSSSSPAGSSSSPLQEDRSTPSRNGLSEGEMRRLKDEMGAAQAALKCLGAILREERFYSLFTGPEISHLLSTALKVGTTTSIIDGAKRDVLPFIIWLISVQRLPYSTIETHSPRIINLLSITLTTPDKARQNLAESILAIGQLVQSHPELILSKWKVWFGGVLEGIWEVPKKGMNVRVRTSMTLGQVVLGLVSKWNSVGEKEKKAKIANDISAEFLRILHLPRGDKTTTLDALQDELTKAFVDEAPWVVTLIGLIPALLGKRFRKLQKEGIRPWIQLVELCRQHSSPHIRNYANLVWPHFVTTFLRSPDIYSQLFVRLKPISLLTQALNQRITWETPGKLHADRSYILAQVVTTLFYGLTVVVRATPSTTPTNISPPRLPLNLTSSSPSKAVVSESSQELQLSYYDIIWTTLVEPAPRPDPRDTTQSIQVQGDLINVINSLHPSTAALGWSMFAAILSPGSKSDKEANLDQLLNIVLLESNFGTSKVAVQQGTMVQKCSDSVVDASSIPAWGSTWVVSRSEKVLTALTNCLRVDMTQEKMNSIIEYVAPVWGNLLTAILSEEENVATNKALLQIIQWLQNIDKVNASVYCDSLRLHLTAIAFEVLGDRLINLTSGGDPLSYADSLVKSFFSSNFSKSDLKVATMLLQNLAESSLEIYHIATMQMLAHRQDESIYSQLCSTWARRLESTTDIGSEIVTVVLQVLRVPSRFATSSECFKELSRTLSTKLSSVIGRDAALLQSFKEAVVSATNLVENLHLTTLLISSVNLQSENVQSLYIELSCYALTALVRGRTSTLKELVELIGKVLTITPDSDLPSIFTHALEELSTILSKPNSDELSTLLPLFAPPLQRIFNVHAAEAEITSTPTSATRPTPLASDRHDAIVVFVKFWRETCSISSQPISIPQDLGNILSVLRNVTDGLDIPTLGESQSSDEHHLPPAAQAQRDHSGESSSLESDTMPEVSGRGYEGDISALNHGETFINSSHGLPSPILENPRIATSISIPPTLSVVMDSIKTDAVLALSTIIDETPPEVQSERSRRSSVVSVTVESAPRVLQRKRNRSSSLPVPVETPAWSGDNVLTIDDDDSDDAVIVTGRRTVNQSSTQSQPAAKKMKQKASTSSNKRSSDTGSSEFKKRRRSNESAVDEVSKAAAESRSSISSRSRSSSSSSSRLESKPVIDYGEEDDEEEEESEQSLQSYPKPVIGFNTPPSPRTAAQTIANFLSLGGIASATNDWGGTQALHMLVEIGKSAKDFLRKPPGANRARSRSVTNSDK